MKVKGLDMESVVTESKRYGTRAYMNSMRGRKELFAELEEEEGYEDAVREILAVWGESPVVEEMEYTEPEPIPDPTGQRLDEIEAAIAELAYGGETL